MFEIFMNATFMYTILSIPVTFLGINFVFYKLCKKETPNEVINNLIENINKEITNSDFYKNKLNKINLEITNNEYFNSFLQKAIDNNKIIFWLYNPATAVWHYISFYIMWKVYLSSRIYFKYPYIKSLFKLSVYSNSLYAKNSAKSFLFFYKKIKPLMKWIRGKF